MDRQIMIKKYSEPCSFFNEGNCRNGDECSFTHYEKKYYEKMREIFPKPCLFLKGKGCKSGENCNFYHGERKFKIIKRKISRVEKKYLIPCRYFNNRGCSRENCKYLHSTEQDSYYTDDYSEAYI